MNEVKRDFKKGEFIMNTNKPGSFAIFEGIEAESYSATKKYSVIVSYDPSKYRELPTGGWGSLPYIEVATKCTRCETTVDGDTSSYWWRPCTESEKEKAIGVLQEYGYYWNEELLSIIDKETGEIVRTVVEPKIEYNGEVVKPISQKLRSLLKRVCDEITKKRYSYQSTYYGGCCGGFWEGDYWD